MPPWPPGPRSPAYVGEQERRLERPRASDAPRLGQGGRPDRRPGAQARAEKPRPARARRVAARRSACRPRTSRAHRRASPTTTAASSSTRSEPETRSSPRHGSSREPTRSSTTSSSSASPRRRWRTRSGLDARSAGLGLELLRRDRASSRRRLRCDPGLAERCELGRRVGAWLGRESPARRHGRAACRPGARS